MRLFGEKINLARLTDFDLETIAIALEMADHSTHNPRFMKLRYGPNELKHDCGCIRGTKECKNHPNWPGNQA